MSVAESLQRAAISVTEMASMCSLSRSRFHCFVRVGVFPPPLRNEGGTRPYYTSDLIERCLEIRRTGIGNNGRVVLFNRRNKPRSVQKRIAQPPAQPAPEHEGLVESLRSLGLNTTVEAVTAAVEKLYPGGVNGTDQGEVIRKVFLHLQGRK